MLPKFFAIAAFLIAFLSILASYTQRSALTLDENREESSVNYWPRHDTHVSGIFIGGNFQTTPARSEYGYGGFRGGGPAAGK